MTKRFFISIISIISCMILNAGSGTIEIKDLEHNVMHNGQKCLGIHLKVTTSGYKGDDFKCVAYVEHPKGTGVKDLNDSYGTIDGNVSTSIKINATYENSVWEDLVLYLPNSEIHPMSGKRTYYIQVYLWRNNTAVASSNYATFDMTGSDNSNVNNNYDDHSHQVQQPQQQRIQTANGYIDYIPQGNGTVLMVTHQVCFMCKGTGMCSLCGGQGGIVHPYLGTYINCTNCSMSGRCKYCKGTGEQVFNSVVDGAGNGYSVDMNGNVVTSGGLGGGGSSSSSSSNSSSSRSSGNDYIETIEYSPNYTGQDNSEWCDICKEIKPAHKHIKKRY